MIKLDLHTHSSGSPDGGISPEQYRSLLSSRQLDCLAITDHDRIDIAQELARENPDTVIVGEEITTQDGDIIGLYLDHVIEPGLSAEEAAKQVRLQGGLVYLPHPFEKHRSGLNLKTCELLARAKLIDIVETHNGRAVFENHTTAAVAFADSFLLPATASSDAHGRSGIGRTYTEVVALPTRETIMELLGEAKITAARPPLHSLLLPKFNKLKNRAKRQLKTVA